jgi:hypothetical protein
MAYLWALLVWFVWEIGRFEGNFWGEWRRWVKERILKGIREINESPVVHRWKKFDLEID